MTKYQLSIHAKKLPRVFFRAPCTYAVVTITGGPKNGTEVGRTETVPKSQSPDWVAVLFVDTDAATYMPVKVQIFHEKEYNDDVLLGEASFEVTEIHSSPGHLQSHKLDGSSGTIYVTVQESQQGSSSGFMELQLRGLDIKNVEPGLLGLGRSDPFIEVSKKNADHVAGVVRWNVVHRTNHIRDHLNPYWDEFAIGLEELCYNDLKWPIRIVVKDWQANGKHRVIGQFETTPETLMDRVAVKGNADREMAFEIFKDTLATSSRSQGLVCVLKATRSE